MKLHASTKGANTLAEEKLEFPRRPLVLGNLGLLAWVLLAFLSLFFYNSIYGILYLIVEAVTIYVILRRLGCSSCYNCKACTSGFGRLAGSFFGKGNIKKGSVGNRLGIVGFVYFLLFAVPIAVSVYSLVGGFSITEIAVLVALLAVALYSFSTWFNHTVNHKV